MDSFEERIFKKYPVAVKRLAQYLIDRRDFDEFETIFRKYNLNFDKMRLNLPNYAPLQEKDIDFMKKLYETGIFIPHPTFVISLMVQDKCFEMFVYYVEKGILKDSSKKELIKRINELSQGPNRVYFFAIQEGRSQKYIDFIEETPHMAS